MPPLEDARSLVLLLEGDAPAAEAHDLSEPNRRVAVEGADELTVLLYDDPLDAMAIDEGTLLPYTGSDGGNLPRPRRAFHRSVRGGEWRELEPEERHLFNGFRLHPVPPSACALRGGCLAHAEDLECVSPCPTPIAPAPPILPPSILPALLPCPSGWSVLERDGISACEPRHEARCGAGTHPFIGGGCEPVGPPCEMDGWPFERKGRAVFFVREGGSGAGGRFDPFGSIDEAIHASKDGAIIAIAPGRYAESLRVIGGRELIGACAEEVVLEGSIDADGAALRSLAIKGVVRIAGRVELGALEIDGGLEVGERAELDATRIWVTSPERAFSLRDGARANVESSGFDAPVALLATAATATITSTLLFGETRLTGGRLSIEASEMLRRGGAALVSTAGAVVVGDHLVIRGPGVEAAVSSAPAALALTRTRVEAEGAGFHVTAASHTTIEDAIFTRATGAGEDAFLFADVGIVVARRVLVEGAPTAFSAIRSNLLVTASTIRGCGRGVFVQDSAEARVDTSVIEDTTDFAIEVEGAVDRPGDTYQLVDLELRRVGGGVGVTRVQVGRIERVAVSGTRGPGLAIGGEASAPVVLAQDLAIEESRCDGERATCAAIAVAGGAIELRHFALVDLEGTGVHIERDGAAVLTDGRIAQAPIGIASFAIDPDPHALLGSIVFEDVVAPCEPCGR